MRFSRTDDLYRPVVPPALRMDPFLLAAVPPRSRRTFIELLCGCLMSQDGWVTRAISMIGRKCHWTTYFKLLERGSLKTQALANQLLRLGMQFSSEAILTFVLDDTLLLRWSDSSRAWGFVTNTAASPIAPATSTLSAG